MEEVIMVVIVGLERALFLSSFVFFIEMILLLLVFWECGVGEGVQFGRFHTRTPEREREGGRRSAAVCVC